MLSDLGLQLTVVYNSKTRKLYPYRYNDYGEIVLMTTEKINLDDVHVGTTYTSNIDLETGYLKELINGKKKF